MIICEIGQNFIGDMEMATRLIWEAKENGADLAKFQLFDSIAQYGQKIETELSFEQANHLFRYGEDIGMEVFFSRA